MKNFIGRTFGNYRVEAILGQGGMASVFLAQHVYLPSKQAAIKIMYKNLTDDLLFQARFLQEAETLARLKHRHIVEIYDFGEQEDCFYLIMEWMKAGTVKDMIAKEVERGQFLTLPTKLNLIRQAADALDFAHAKGVVHRDIKPDNLLLSIHSERISEIRRYELKISDFGLVRLKGGGKVQTGTGSIMGTPQYMSPEQCQGEQDLDGRSDIYSLGVVLYEWLTKRLPFDVQSASDAILKHVLTPPYPPSRFCPDLPDGLEDVILRCLSKKREDRHVAAKDLSLALQNILKVKTSGQLQQERQKKSASQPHIPIDLAHANQGQELVSETPKISSTSPVPKNVETLQPNFQTEKFLTPFPKMAAPQTGKKDQPDQVSVNPIQVRSKSQIQTKAEQKRTVPDPRDPTEKDIPIFEVKPQKGHPVSGSDVKPQSQKEQPVSENNAQGNQEFPILGKGQETDPDLSAFKVDSQNDESSELVFSRSQSDIRRSRLDTKSEEILDLPASHSYFLTFSDEEAEDEQAKTPNDPFPLHPPLAQEKKNDLVWPLHSCFS